MQVKKAVIPAAGYGTRMLPLTKALPKEFVPIVDKPSIQFLVEEAAASGIEDVLIIVSRGKELIESHFDRCPELETKLEKGGKAKQLEQILGIAGLANIFFIRQPEMRGTGAAIHLALHRHRTLRRALRRRRDRRPAAGYIAADAGV